jgi:hypothetical protein
MCVLEGDEIYWGERDGMEEGIESQVYVFSVGWGSRYCERDCGRCFLGRLRLIPVSTCHVSSVDVCVASLVGFIWRWTFDCLLGIGELCATFDTPIFRNI